MVWLNIEKIQALAKKHHCLLLGTKEHEALLKIKSDIEYELTSIINSLQAEHSITFNDAYWDEMSNLTASKTIKRFSNIIG